MFGVRIQKHLSIDTVIENQRRGRVPVGNHHSKISAGPFAVTIKRNDVHRRSRGEFGKIPLPRYTHFRIAAKLVELQYRHYIVTFVHKSKPENGITSFVRDSRFDRI